MSAGHAFLAPSGAHRWIVCPGFPRLAHALPDAGSSSYSDEGTVCHALAEEFLTTGGGPASWLGKEWSVSNEAGDKGSKVLVTEDMVAWVMVAVEFVLKYLRARPQATLHCEEKLPTGRAFGVGDNLGGTGDVVISFPGTPGEKSELVIGDFKFGYVEVELESFGDAPIDLLGESEAPLERNPQLLLYAIGAMHLYGWAHEQVRLVVLQPRSAVPVKEVVLTCQGLEDQFLRLKPKVHAALDPKAPLVASDECRYCPAAGACPELQKRAIELAQRELGDPNLLPLARLGEIVAASDRIKKGLDAAQALATRMMTLGTHVPGLKLVRGTKHRVWRDEKAAEQKLLALGRKPSEVRPPAKLISPAAAEKLLTGPAATLLAPLIDKPIGEKVAVKLDDRRKEVEPDFAPLDDSSRLL